MPSHAPRIVAVDPGSRRVGLALADPLRLFAQPWGTFPPDRALEALRRLHAEEGIAAIVLGWPLEPDGTEGPAVARVRPFYNRLRRTFPRVAIVPWDERGSSRRAAEVLRAAGVRKKERAAKGRLDRAAAAVILQEYLDERAPGLAPPPP